ncbi:hypothetical protein WICMUC_004335 [Wickerhamomyces mucosus]|uniref:Transcription regulator Rua1 C-terminal domain-containing protein n=1 Tax=Wickerhamomyces mucosus TaxID=1378264 RepID=A0A9P8TAF0_9ASCO|nr:hypothetical protein WICMUC_004335 [Wickerhamomyces mucosus]
MYNSSFSEICSKFISQNQVLSSQVIIKRVATEASKSVENFTVQYKAYGHRNEDFLAKLVANSAFEPSNGYRSSNVCFIETGLVTPYKSEKPTARNIKSILCPYCDPFKDGNPESHFYDSVSSSYSHHLENHHGIRKNKDIVTDPFLGVCNTANGASLKIICPYDIGGKACCHAVEFKHNHEDPFKGYLRHVKLYHYGKVSSKASKLSPADLSYIINFIPLSAKMFYQTKKFCESTHGYIPEFTYRATVDPETQGAITRSIKQNDKEPAIVKSVPKKRTRSFSLSSEESPRPKRCHSVEAPSERFLDADQFYAEKIYTEEIVVPQTLNNYGTIESSVEPEESGAVEFNLESLQGDSFSLDDILNEQMLASTDPVDCSDLLNFRIEGLDIDQYEKQEETRGFAQYETGLIDTFSDDIDFFFANEKVQDLNVHN